jgi:hypothetical protein
MVSSLSQYNGHRVSTETPRVTSLALTGKAALQAHDTMSLHLGIAFAFHNLFQFSVS